MSRGWYYAEALVEEFGADGREPPQLGLVCSAYMGSTISQWLPGMSSCRSRAARLLGYGWVLREGRTHAPRT